MNSYKDKLKKSYNLAYSENENFFGKKVSPPVKKILEYKNGGTVLELGCGQGIDSIFLAENGFDVTAVDFSEKGIYQLKQKCNELEIDIKAITEDITKFNFDRKYDIIFSNFTLHFLEKNEVNTIINNMKDYTNENGLNIISTFIDDEVQTKFKYPFPENKLKDEYSDWKTLLYKEWKSGLKSNPDTKKKCAVIISQKQ